jgi:hypothetical protein
LQSPVKEDFKKEKVIHAVAERFRGACELSSIFLVDSFEQLSRKVLTESKLE